MSAPTAILHKPITRTTTTYTFLPVVKSLKPISSLEFPSSKLLFPRESVSRNRVTLHKTAWSPNTMTGSTTTTSAAGEEGVGAFEQESFIHGSSEFRPNSAAAGLESTVNRLSKWLVTILFGAILLWRHDAESLWAAMGSVLNAGLSTILKQVLNQERPVSTLRSDPGMPSSHAQSIFFTCLFFVISMFQWLGVNGLAITLSGFALAFGSYLSWLRVSQQLHTINQVVVGAVIGSTFSILWFVSWDAVVLKAFNSYLWVRILVILGAVGFCVGFFIHVIRYWITDR